ncbi:MAG: PD-(D/E)XK nuclease family protein [Myxococcota bacterium]|nr:PD-(D/E)XK nuclease family protein [Myxococcota bacterium]
MGRELTNDFSWSKSRHEKFGECLRAYYFHYYASWGGWSETAPETARQLYTLKKLGNRWTWAGSVVHETIKQVLLRLRAGRDVDPAKVIDYAHRVMQDDWRHSAAKRYWQQKNRKDFSGLVEHEYGEAVPGEEWKKNWENARGALQWFLGSRWMDLARSLQPHQWIEVDDKSFDDTVFHMDEVRVFAIPDFAYVDHDGAPVVVDWKTGRAREGYDDQILGYALYLSKRYDLRLDRMQAAIVYLNDGLERLVRIDEEALRGFKAHFAQSVGRMREVLADPEKNIPRDQTAFPMTQDLSVCGRCVFRRSCGREGVALTPPVVVQGA